MTATDKNRYVVIGEWLAVETGRCTCAGGIAGYPHEPHCGLDAVEKLDVLADVLVPKSRAEQAEARLAKVEAIAAAMLEQFTEYADERHAYMHSRKVGTTVVNAWRAVLAAPEDDGDAS
jgi:hypothetical protein